MGIVRGIIWDMSEQDWELYQQLWRRTSEKMMGKGVGMLAGAVRELLSVEEMEWEVMKEMGLVRLANASIVAKGESEVPIMWPAGVMRAWVAVEMMREGMGVQQVAREINQAMDGGRRQEFFQDPFGQVLIGIMASMAGLSELE